MSGIKLLMSGKKLDFQSHSDDTLCNWH